jgi:DNA (cytosine-5)-methyltransferase 1
MMLNHLDLFSGIGGFALAARWVGGIRTIGFCDNEKYAWQVLAKNFPGVPIYEDVRELHPDVIVPRDGRIDFLTCGFPCQDLSVAGNQKGIEAERSGLFFEITRLSDEILAYCGTRPSLVLENVPNILAGDGGSWARAVYGELAVRGYCVEWKTLGATHVGAPHRRLRWWAVCYMGNPNLKRLERHNNWDSSTKQTESQATNTRTTNIRFGRKTLAHTNCNGFDQRRGSVSKTGSNGTFRNSRRSTQCGLGGMVDGIPDWVDEPGDIPRVTKGQKNRVSRLKGLGNAVVPQCAMIPLMRLKEVLT